MTNETDSYPSTDKIFNKTIQINALISRVWEALTDPELMKIWKADTETEIDSITNWTVGSPMLIRGKLHRVKFENKGTVLQFEPETILQYSHLSSISRLPDTLESYSLLLNTHSD